MPDHQFPPTPPGAGYSGIEADSIRRYVAGECTPEDHRHIDGWAAESPERRRYLRALMALRRRGSADDGHRSAAAWSRIAAGMAQPDASVAATYVAPWEEPAIRVDVRRRRRTRVLAGAFGPRTTRWWPLLAAAGVAFAFAGFNAAIGTRDHSVTPRAAAMREILTAKGQRAEIQLEDGSHVVLGVASRLRLPSDFGVRGRDVYLDGTAYFDVVHDSAHPFAVHTANAIARDVGTRFVVSAYPESRSTRVVVRDGSVALGSVQSGSVRAPSVLLTGGHLGHVREGDTVVTNRTVDPTLYTAWMQGNLVFHDVPLSEAVTELRRWYDVDIEIGDSSLRDMPISAAFAVESLHEALAVVTTVLPLRAVRRGNVVTLYRRPQ